MAEDLAQEVLVLLHEKYGHVTQLSELLPLSLQIARFKIAGIRRKSYRRGEYSAVPVEDLHLSDGKPDPSEEAERRERLDCLTKALAALGERCREIMRLKLEGKGFPEIQKIMGAANLNTVYTWDFRCRKSLLELMGRSND